MAACPVLRLLVTAATNSLLVFALVLDVLDAFSLQ